MISLQKGFVFVHVPKTGGNSIQNVLRRYSEDEITSEQPYQDGVERFGVRNRRYGTGKHAPLWRYREVLEPAVYHASFKFAVVRNPWDRAISTYFSPHRGVSAWDRDAFLHMLGSVPLLSDFVCDRQRRARPVEGLGSPCDQPGADLDFLIRFEHLDRDFEQACRRIGIPHEPLSHRNASCRTHYSHYYDDELRRIVGERFAEEIRAFGYEFESSAT